MLKRAETRHGIEHPEALPIDLPRVLEVNLEPMPAACGQLRRGQRHPDPVPAARLGVGEQRTPATAKIKQTAPRPDPDLFGHIIVLAVLCLLRG